MPNYKLLNDGTFVIEDYNNSKTFSSFFPGVAGLMGIPMWAFYVNRGQCIASFGIRNKNQSIMEFQPANTAYSIVQKFGFRTFLKSIEKKRKFIYEPFSLNNGEKGKVFQRMYIRPHELYIEDENTVLGIKTGVKYFTLPGESVSALMREVTVENISKKDISFEILDGMPKIIPYWISNDLLKNMSHTAQAWVRAEILKEINAAFFKMKVEINDSTEVSVLGGGNFYLPVSEKSSAGKNIRIFADPEIIFGQDTGYSFPSGFLNGDIGKMGSKDCGNMYPCAMNLTKADLSKGEKQVTMSYVGYASSQGELKEFSLKASKPGFFTAKNDENRELINSITDLNHTESSSKVFDMYCRQNFLDNVLRGGLPVMLPCGLKETVFYAYSRKHGDPERDYNFFELAPSFFSQGNGNFRDICQNRRNDIFFNPKIEDFNIINFYNLVQLDGYNPLVVKGQSYSFSLNERKSKTINGIIKGNKFNLLKEFFRKPFTPGSLLLFLKKEEISLDVPYYAFLRLILADSIEHSEAEHCEGFWTDHWTYNLDLLESYLAVYPEKLKSILLEKKIFSYFDNAHVVLPRSEKYVLTEAGVRQFGSVRKDEQKEELLRKRIHDKFVVRASYGKGEIYRTNLLVKMIVIILNKFATLDPEGIGIEMEAEKPGWYDALNGLPGVFGSSVPETFELKRLVIFLSEKLSKLNLSDGYDVSLLEEVNNFINGLKEILFVSDSISPYDFWNRVTTLKEKYRHDTAYGVCGAEKNVPLSEIKGILAKILKKVDSGLKKAQDEKTGLFNTYFSYSAEEFEKTGKTNQKGLPLVSVSKFKKRALPLFLESEVHYLKIEKDPLRALEHLKSLKKSGLYDKTLKMFKVNDSLQNEPSDIGRCTVFTPGWLENESIWLHMEYKYLLELLRCGLKKEFFEELKNCCVCLLKPEIYGRSVLENSSFIASGVFNKEADRGRGFVARLSGSTAEFIHMWLIMTVGQHPFCVNEEGQLCLKFSPSIPGDFFSKKGEFSFMFLGKTRVTYINPKRQDTFSATAKIKKIEILWPDGSKNEIQGDKIQGNDAARIRRAEGKQINIHY